MRQGILLGLLMATLGAIGCSGDLPRGKVTGVIKHKGKPLSRATVMFMTKDNQVYRGDLKEDGSYVVPDVPFGPVKACVQQALPTVAPRADGQAVTTSAARDKPAMGEKRDQKWQPPPAVAPDHGPDRLPLKYGDPNKSELAFELTKDGQDWSVDLQ
jgi:hypothetical protein